MNFFMWAGLFIGLLGLGWPVHPEHLDNDIWILSKVLSAFGVTIIVGRRIKKIN